MNADLHLNSGAGTVTTRALVGRINRRLAKEGWGDSIRKCPPRSRSYDTCGDYYVVRNNFVTHGHLDLAAFARSLDVMHEAEVLADSNTGVAR